MILPGRVAVARGIVNNLILARTQIQPCGVDLSVRKVSRYTSGGCIDFGNHDRILSTTQNLPLASPSGPEGKRIHLEPGNYLVEFNETVDIPLDIMGQIFVRSSLWRSGVMLNAGVVDAGYKGVVGAMMQVSNSHGLMLYTNARLAQIVFHQMTEATEGYDGMYQGSKTI